jgi:transposase
MWQKIIETYKSGINEVIGLIKDMHNNFNEKISGLQTENEKLNARITELEAKINKNSNNSSKPPSTDGYKKPKVTNSRTKSNKKTGGQPGHVGVTLDKISNPNEVFEINTDDFCSCSYDLSNVESSVKTRQVFDIPKIEVKVTEYKVHEKVCPICGKVHKAEFPANVTQPVQYGEKMKALIVYLKDYQFLPLKRTAEAIKDITNQKISQGTIVNISEQLSASLENVVEEIKEEIKNSDVIHSDETGVRVGGKTQWMHVASTETLTHYQIHEKRGYEATSAIGILPNFKGTLVHDHWKPLYKYEECTHAECNAHNIRYLLDIYENYKQEWANRMISILV